MLSLHVDVCMHPCAFPNVSLCVYESLCVWIIVDPSV